jgi:hypothetical protein
MGKDGQTNYKKTSLSDIVCKATLFCRNGFNFLTFAANYKTNGSYSNGRPKKAVSQDKARG